MLDLVRTLTFILSFFPSFILCGKGNPNVSLTKTPQDTLAVKRGYGKKLASGMIKVEGPHDEDSGMYILDWAYGAFRQGHDTLPEIVKRLGWTGDEDVDAKTETEGEHGHWEDGVTLKEGVYASWRRDS